MTGNDERFIVLTVVVGIVKGNYNAASAALGIADEAIKLQNGRANLSDDFRNRGRTNFVRRDVVYVEFYVRRKGYGRFIVRCFGTGYICRFRTVGKIAARQKSAET